VAIRREPILRGAFADVFPGARLRPENFER